MNPLNKIFYWVVAYITICLLLEPESPDNLTRINAASPVTRTEDSAASSPAGNKSSWFGKSWWFGREGNPCCGDLLERERAGIRTFSNDLPASCYVEGATCALYGLYDPAPAPAAAMKYHLTCLRLPTGGVLNQSVKTNTCHRMFETMTYGRRLLAVMTLWAVSGGAPFLFLSLEVFLLHHAWVFRESGESVFFLVAFTAFTCGTMRDIIDHALFELWREFFDFSFVNEFNGPLALYDGHRKKRETTKGKRKNNNNKKKRRMKSYMLAQMPHGVMPYGALLGASVLDDLLPGVWPVSGVVATALLHTPVLRHLINYLGVRKASTRMIHQMFADGYQGVGVVTGGIAEMFVSSEQEKLTSIRRNFGRAALTGGHSIVPIFCFGVSRTLGVVPGFNNRVVKALSRKMHLPIMLYWGAFGLVPHRQQLKLVVGRPIKVNKAVGEVKDKQAQALCDKVEKSVEELYNRHKPFWETRPITYFS